MTPHTAEAAFNASLADILRKKHPLWEKLLGVEQTAVVVESTLLRPDIIIRSTTSQPVVVETEFLPANTVEKDATDRLGLTLRDSGDRIEQTIALRIPSHLQRAQESLPRRIAGATFEYCLFSGSPSSPVRWPKDGWLSGGVDDLARCIEHASLSERLINQYIEIFAQGVTFAANILANDSNLFPDPPRRIASALNQGAGEQTIRMAMTIVANALTFHETVAGTHDIASIDDLRSRIDSRPRKSAVLACWDRILNEVNYWPIFHIASTILEPIRTPTANRILHILAKTAEELAGIGIATMHDLSGRMFQKLIADRKFLATFYTLPTSATLLAELAIDRLDFDWSNREAYPNLRIADLSCGTGTLLSAAYQSILARYRRAEGNDADIHKRMIELSLIAADIMPAATHLAASQLSSAHPTITFADTRIYTMPYGNDSDGPCIGSLDLTVRPSTKALFATGQRRAHGKRGDIQDQDAVLPHGSLDLAIMNPPFTRPTNHESATIPIPSFAGFETSDREQRAMSDRLKKIRQRILKCGISPAGHGNAGLASNFIDLAHAKIKPRGTVAFVLPITFAQGVSWTNARNLLADYYSDIVIVTIATSGSHDRAFSADTGIAEALVVANRTSTGKAAPSINRAPILFINLYRRPQNLLEAAEIASAIGQIPKHSSAGRITIGVNQIGSYVRAPITEGGCVGLRQPSLAKTLTLLSAGTLHLPQYSQPLPVATSTLGALGERGLLDRDIAGEGRGPFNIVPIIGIPSYPVLWRHSAKRERCLFVAPDTEGEVRDGCEDAAVRVWRSATRLHFNRDFRLNSQSLAACLTPGRTLGGTAWPNFSLDRKRWEAPIVLWANGTLGLMSFWWAGTRQQQGRTRLTISALPDLFVLDPRRLSDAQLDTAAKLLGQFQQRALLPANEAYRDDTRKSLDRAVLVELLGLPEDILEPLARLRLQWCAEPSVHGGKHTQPSKHRGLYWPISSE
ncbi:MAG: hypothetical protein OXT71_17605 [Acidobacteriota bacterium]|nr:hypothetical protein [Acidobacteriota bacterium]